MVVAGLTSSKGISVLILVSVVAARSVLKALLAAVGAMIVANRSSSRTGGDISGNITSRTWTRRGGASAAGSGDEYPLLNVDYHYCPDETHIHLHSLKIYTPISLGLI